MHYICVCVNYTLKVAISPSGVVYLYSALLGPNGKFTLHHHICKCTKTSTYAQNRSTCTPTPTCTCTLHTCTHMSQCAHQRPQALDLYIQHVVNIHVHVVTCTIRMQNTVVCLQWLYTIPKPSSCRKQCTDKHTYKKGNCMKNCVHSSIREHRGVLSAWDKMYISTQTSNPSYRSSTTSHMPSARYTYCQHSWHV